MLSLDIVRRVLGSYPWLKISSSTVAEMGFNVGIKSPLKSNDDGSKTIVYPGDVVN